ncbi:MAG: AEC family transporter, partial [Lachnospiraceae bacterium]|nr:AEC family transporter [Lachnospiraceae bacterium]
MLNSFLIAFNAVMPFLILMGIGAVTIRLKLSDRAFMNRLNGLTFRVFFPFMLFYNVYNSKPENMPSMKLILTAVIALTLLIGSMLVIVPRIVPENPRRGVIIQAIYRSNLVIYGIPLTAHVFGPERASICGMVTLVIVSLFNIYAVIVLEIFREGGSIDPGRLIRSIICNPLLQGCVAGLVFFLLNIKLPTFIMSPVSSMASAATTLAIIVLGANLRFEELKKNRHIITVVVAIRLIIIPLIMLLIGYAAGLRDIELFLMLMIFGTPVAASSYPMAQNMGGDGQLAGQLVLETTAAS